jgi:hypothetical protein
MVGEELVAGAELEVDGVVVGYVEDEDGDGEEVGQGRYIFVYWVEQPTGQVVRQMLVVGMVEQPHDWVMVESMMQSATMHGLGVAHGGLLYSVMV